MKLTRGRIASLLKQKKQTFKKTVAKPQSQGGNKTFSRTNHLGTVKHKKRLTCLHNKTLRRI